MHRLMADLMPQWQHGRIIEKGEVIGNEDVEAEAHLFPMTNKEFDEYSRNLDLIFLQIQVWWSIHKTLQYR